MPRNSVTNLVVGGTRVRVFKAAGITPADHAGGTAKVTGPVGGILLKHTGFTTDTFSTAATGIIMVECVTLGHETGSDGVRTIGFPLKPNEDVEYWSYDGQPPITEIWAWVATGVTGTNATTACCLALTVTAGRGC
jgi:hypothetical protein